MGAVIFAVTYVLISVRKIQSVRLGRSLAVVLGAVCMVAMGVLTPRRALAAIDVRTLALLLGMMGMGAFLARDGVFDRLEVWVRGRLHTATALLGVIVGVSGCLSMLLTNDAVCVLGAPIVVRLIRRFQLPPLPFLLGLATAANTGSVGTLVGNPQNMLCASLGHLEYRQHALLFAPVAIAGLALNQLLLVAAFPRELRGVRLDAGTDASDGADAGQRPWVTIAIVGATTVFYLSGANLARSALVGWGALLVLRPRQALDAGRRIDGSVLLFFAGLFVVVEGLVQSGVPAWFFWKFPLWPTGASGPFAWARLVAIFLVGSNVVSNVPFIVVVGDQVRTLPDPRLGWELLAMASTFAGNLTLLGSVANVIVAESGREVGGMGYLAYLRVGVPLAVLTTALGTAWLLWLW